MSVVFLQWPRMTPYWMGYLYDPFDRLFGHCGVTLALGRFWKVFTSPLMDCCPLHGLSKSLKDSLSIFGSWLTRSTLSSLCFEYEVNCIMFISYSYNLITIYVLIILFRHVAISRFAKSDRLQTLDQFFFYIWLSWLYIYYNKLKGKGSKLPLNFILLVDFTPTVKNILYLPCHQ